MRAASIAVVVVLALGGAALAAADSTDWADQKIELGPKGSSSYSAFAASFAKSQAICRAVRNAKAPAADTVSPRQAAALKGCDAEALYYGEKGPPDYVKARQCAMAQSENGEVPGDEVFGGLTILAQLYANGLGVAKNLDLATHYACNIEGATAEVHGRVTHLAEIKAKGPGKTRFDFCDDITSGLAQGYCADRAQTLTNARRQGGLNALTARVTPAARPVYARLRKAAETFASLHGDNETDLSGTGRAAFSIEATEEERNLFAKTLRALLDGKIAPAKPAQARAADDALNASWRKLRAHGQKVQTYGTVTLDDVVQAQRAWIAYRDAFTAFARAQGPGRPADGLFVRVTRDRIATLDGLPG